MAVMGQDGSFQRILTFGRQRVLRRLETGAKRKDLFYYLVCHHAGSGMLTPR